MGGEETERTPFLSLCNGDNYGSHGKEETQQAELLRGSVLGSALVLLHVILDFSLQNSVT